MTYVRPNLKTRGPNRSAGGFLRIVPGQKGGKVFGGVPLQATEDAVVAAVRAGYRIVDEQIDRGTRIAQELRGAAARAGAGEPKDVLGSAEALARKGLLSGLEWLETLAAQPAGPLKRMLSAEYRLLGTLIGLEFADSSDAEAQLQKLQKQRASAATTNEHPQPMESSPAAARPVIVFDQEPRAVELIKWELFGDLPSADLQPLKFARTGAPKSTFSGRIGRGPSGKLVLGLTLSQTTREGRWKAAICGPDKVLLGIVIVEL